MPRLPRRINAPKGRRGRTALLVATAVVVVLGILLLPGLMALGNGYAAKRGTADALAALRAGDLEDTRESLADVRDDVDDMRRAATGGTGTLWGWLPGGDTDRGDVTHLTAALDDLTAVAETAVAAYPEESAGDGFLIDSDRRIDVDGLGAVLGESDAIQRLTDHAVTSLEQVTGDGLYGLALGHVRDAALARVEPLDAALRVAEPLLPHLPRILGADGPQTYVLALLNPAEQRFSGGAALTFTSMTIDDGKISPGQPLTATNSIGAFNKFYWRPVGGNPFHPEGKNLRLSTAALAPSWRVSGEELARAWTALRDEPVAGVIAFDVIALQDLMRFTGAIEVAGYGVLDSTNLVESMIGSYDEYTSAEAFLQRRAGSQELISTFQSRLLSPADVAGKVSSLISGAEGRHVAAFFMDPGVREAVEELGLAGELSDTPHDYVGVFNQATSGHKADYWQRRNVTSDVRLAPDGSARVTLRIEILNDAPPPAEDVLPSFANYVRRDNDMALAAFLPSEVRLTGASVDGVPFEPEVEDFYGRPFVRTRLQFDAGESHTLVLGYVVPNAAEMAGDRLTYRLDLDPQAMVDPQAVEVTVHWPEGYATPEVPDGWTADDGGAHFETEDLTTSPRWELHASRTT